MNNISYETLEKIGYEGYVLPKDAPEKVLQFGEGNFLRAFVDRFFDMGNEATGWNGRVVMVQPISGAFDFADGINAQDGLYTVLVRGKENGDTVDDSRVICAEMKKMLEGSDIEIIGYCRSGEEALEQYGTMKQDLVTLDIVMPGMDGLETCKKLREHYPEANNFMVSSMAYDDMIDRAAALGAKGFLFKPFTRETLLEGLKGAFKAIHL